MRLGAARSSTAIAGATSVFAIMALALLVPQRSHAQPGSGGGGGGGGGDGGGGGGSGPDDGTTSDVSISVVECANDGSAAHYEEFLAGTNVTMVRWAGTLTGCPNHVNWALNPTTAQEIPSNESIPAYPMLFENSGTTDLSMSAGNIGIMRNGVGMYSAWAADRVVEYEDTAFYLESDTFDLCGGHATPTGSYHYHGTAGCLQEHAGGVVGEHSPQLGWSYDGFPFYGQLGPGGVEMKMCGAEGADPTVCLDGCSGYEAFIAEDEYAYRYYTSCGFDESFFPFTANCYRGCCPDGVTCSNKVEACGSGAQIGYTDDLVPVASEPLDDAYDADLIVGNDVDFIGSNSSVDCTLYLGAGSVSASLAGNLSTPSPTASTTTTADAETPSPEIPSSLSASPAPEIPVTTSPRSGGDGASQSSGASGAYSSAGTAFLAISAAGAFLLTI